MNYFLHCAIDVEFSYRNSFRVQIFLNLYPKSRPYSWVEKFIAVLKMAVRRKGGEGKRRKQQEMGDKRSRGEDTEKKMT